MSADPRTLAANLELFVNYYGTDPGVPMSAVDEAAAGAAFIRSMVPLHDAWLKAKPPCPTCGGKGEEPPRIHYGRATTYTTGCICRDCSDGVLPFDKWTAGLVALWTLAGVVEHRLLTDELRQIGGAR